MTKVQIELSDATARAAREAGSTRTGSGSATKSRRSPGLVNKTLALGYGVTLRESFLLSWAAIGAAK